MAGIFGKIKDVSSAVANKTAQVTSNVWDKHGDAIVEQGLQLCYEAAKYGKRNICDDQKYQQLVVDRLWDLMPPPVRLIGRDRLGWDSRMFGVRDQIFLIEGETVIVRPDAKQQLLGSMMSLFGVHMATDSEISHRLE